MAQIGRWSPGVVCIVNGCPTRIQRTVTGTIDDGHIAHLNTVHNIVEDEARRLLKKIRRQ
jgi:hypothetical protein